MVRHRLAVGNVEHHETRRFRHPMNSRCCPHPAHRKVRPEFLHRPGGCHRSSFRDQSLRCALHWAINKILFPSAPPGKIPDDLKFNLTDLFASLHVSTASRTVAIAGDDPSAIRLDAHIVASSGEPMFPAICNCGIEILTFRLRLPPRKGRFDSGRKSTPWASLTRDAMPLASRRQVNHFDRIVPNAATKSAGPFTPLQNIEASCDAGKRYGSR